MIDHYRLKKYIMQQGVRGKRRSGREQEGAEMLVHGRRQLWSRVLVKHLRAQFDTDR